MKKYLLVTLTVISFFANAEEIKSDDKAKKDGSDIRCEKILSTSLGDFKEKLVENCDLTKPFSTSLSRVLKDEVYLYCCHKK